MDNNSQQPVVPPTQSTQAAPQAPASVAATPHQASPKVEATIVASAPSSLNMKVFMVVGLLVILLATGGGLYWYLQEQAKVATVPIQTQVKAPIKKAADVNLETQLNALDASSSADDFTVVDEDLNNL